MNVHAHIQSLVSFPFLIDLVGFIEIGSQMRVYFLFIRNRLIPMIFWVLGFQKTDVSVISSKIRGCGGDKKH